MLPWCFLLLLLQYTALGPSNTPLQCPHRAQHCIVTAKLNENLHHFTYFSREHQGNTPGCYMVVTWLFPIVYVRVLYCSSLRFHSNPLCCLLQTVAGHLPRQMRKSFARRLLNDRRQYKRGWNSLLSGWVVHDPIIRHRYLEVWFDHKVYVFWEGHKNLTKSQHLFNLISNIGKGLCRDFIKFLWLSQNIWNLIVCMFKGGN